jgi:hypothetical protein
MNILENQGHILFLDNQSIYWDVSLISVLSEKHNFAIRFMSNAKKQLRLNISFLQSRYQRRGNL